jgi:glucosylceramidase
MIDTSAKTIIYNPEFYSLKHFAHFLQPGAERISLSALVEIGNDNAAISVKSVVAFRNPSGELVLMIGNRSRLDLPVTVCAGTHSAKLGIPGQSMNTIVLTHW